MIDQTPRLIIIQKSKPFASANEYVTETLLNQLNYLLNIFFKKFVKFIRVESYYT